MVRHRRGTNLGSNSLPQKDTMKGKRKEVSAETVLIEQYKELFTPQPIPSGWFGYEENSFKLPSVLKSVPSTAMPTQLI